MSDRDSNKDVIMDSTWDIAMLTQMVWFRFVGDEI